jgi:hypothetical protein
LNNSDADANANGNDNNKLKEIIDALVTSQAKRIIMISTVRAARLTVDISDADLCDDEIYKESKNILSKLSVYEQLWRRAQVNSCYKDDSIEYVFKLLKEKCVNLEHFNLNYPLIITDSNKFLKDLIDTKQTMFQCDAHAESVISFSTGKHIKFWCKNGSPNDVEGEVEVEVAGRVPIKALSESQHLLFQLDYVMSTMESDCFFLYPAIQHQLGIAEYPVQRWLSWPFWFWLRTGRIVDDDFSLLSQVIWDNDFILNKKKST